ncbi:MAG: hypothetical protein B7Z62_09425, partial [Deltaproteobacteria bacterium 37-65-8]
MRHISLVVGILAAASLFVGGSGCSKEPAPPQAVVKRQAPKPEAPAVAPVAKPAESAAPLTSGFQADVDAASLRQAVALCYATADRKED